MKHQKRVRQLNRNSSERKALMRTLAISLIQKGKVRTTVAKAKALRPFIEPLVTKALDDTLSNRRLVASRIPHPDSVRKLFEDYGKRYSNENRKGGYTRVIKLSGVRRGDAAPIAEIHWV